MIRNFYNAVVERNVLWIGNFVTEPYECGWSQEALFFITSLKGSSGGKAQVQISADGMHWCNEGSILDLPNIEGGTTFCKVSHFGNWLRLIGTTDRPITVLVTLSLKS
jgi:hypothetical protein